MAETVFWAGPLASMIVSVLLFLVFLFGCHRFFRWLWGRLPYGVVSVPSEQIHTTVALLLSFIFFPSLILYAWSTAQALINYIPDVLQAVSSFQIPSSCGRSYDLENARCVSDFSTSLAKLIGFISGRLVSTLSLSRFPAADFVWFLLTAVVLTQVLSTIRKATEVASLRSWYTSVQAALPEFFWQRFTFTILVIVSFYLGLCALLAIPLFQEKAQSQQLTADALGKALDANILKPDLFEQRFPKDPPALRTPSLTKSADNYAQSAVALFNVTVRTQEMMWQDQQSAWSTLRATGASGPTAWRDQAINAFTAGIEVSSGRKQTAQHFNDLFLWHQQLSQLTRDALARCQSAITAFTFTAFQISDNLRLAVEASTPKELFSNESGQSQQGYSVYDSARRLCELGDGDRPAIPQRPAFSSALGAVGIWTRWLLDTGQMPVVIITGLVGFSLLGATVSRAVRAKDENLKAGLTLDDLLSVVAGGMTAAVVVFLAAYGGLAVLGNSGSDPNPYVVFFTCLIGAVYSEDVWSWARKRLLTSRTDASGEKGREEGQGPQKPRQAGA